MRKYIGISIGALLAIFFLLSPYLIGRFLERHYQIILNSYDAAKKVNIQLESYHRGWFTSVATLRLQVIDPAILHYFYGMEIQKNKVLESVKVEQTIQHGPVFYHGISYLPHIVGFAATENTMHLSPALQALLTVIKDADYISFLGNYYKYFELANINVIYPGTDIKIKIDHIKGSSWIFPTRKNIKGDIVLDRVLFDNVDAGIVIPTMSVQFDTDLDWWWGDTLFDIPSVSLIEDGNETFNLTGLQLKGSSKVIQGILSGRKTLTLQRVTLNGYKAGPWEVVFSFKQLNAQAVEDMIEAYHAIKQRGELYQSQLVKKMLMMLPKVFEKGITLSLDRCHLKTQDGVFDLKGNISWNMEKESIPEELKDILTSANANLDLKIAKPLMNRWIEFASTLPWFNTMFPQLDRAYVLAQYDAFFTMQYNEFGLLELVNQGQLSDDEAKKLIELQKMNISMMDYEAVVKELLLTKVITGETSHILLYLYTQAQAPLESIRILMQKSQEKIAEDMWMQLKSWITEGYIKQHVNDYEVLFIQENNRIKINDKWLPQE